MLAEGRIVDHDGPLDAATPFVPRSVVWFHRDLPDEAPVPFAIEVVHRDDEIVVVDKPHFLATIPRGRHVRETVLVRLRDRLGLPALSPAHRLDRVTAGLLLFVVDPSRRGTYQNLFRDRRVAKAYEAVAAHDPDVDLPARRPQPHRQGARRVVTAQEVPGEPNAETLVELVDARDGAGALPADARAPGAPTSCGCTWPRSACRSSGTPSTPRSATSRSTTSARRCSCWRASCRSPTRAPARCATSPAGARLQAWDDPEGWRTGP